MESSLLCSVLLHELTPVQEGQGETKERGRCLHVGSGRFSGRFCKQGS